MDEFDRITRDLAVTGGAGMGCSVHRFDALQECSILTATNGRPGYRRFIPSQAAVKTMNDFNRITRDPAVMGGKPCIRGLRVTVGTIVAQIGVGRTVDELLLDYPYLERDDVGEALRYAGRLA